MSVIALLKSGSGSGKHEAVNDWERKVCRKRLYEQIKAGSKHCLRCSTDYHDLDRCLRGMELQEWNARYVPICSFQG